MRWGDLRRSENVEDRRGMSVGRTGAALSGTGLIVILAIAFITGENPLNYIDLASDQSVSTQPGQEGQMGAPGDQLGEFSAAVLGSTEDVWTRVFAAGGRRYEEPRLVLFSGAVESACGFTSAAVGPFYCPLDKRVYIDLSFFAELDRRFGAPGDFAQAYVIAHEVGHHVQNLLGISDKVRSAQRGASQEEGECAVRPSRAAGRLPGGGVGEPGAAGDARARAGRPRGRAQGRRRDRRRSDAAPSPGLYGAGELDARLLGDARPLAAARPAERQHPGVRYLRIQRRVAAIPSISPTRARTRTRSRTRMRLFR